MALLNIDGNDYSGNCVPGTYQINIVDTYTSWIDATGTTHRKLDRSKVSGSVDLIFKNMEEYQSFILHLRNNTNIDGSVLMSVRPNNVTRDMGIYAFYSMDPVRNTSGTFKDYIEQFTLEINEK